MRPRRRKIRLDRGDTLGGTVPLLLRDSVTPNGTEGRFLHRDRGDGPGLGLYLTALLALVILATGLWLGFPEKVALIGLPTAPELWERIAGFFSVPE